MEENNNSFKFIFRAFKRHIIIFLCIVFVCILFGGCYAKATIKPNYQSESLVSINGGDTKITPAIKSTITSKSLVVEVVYDHLKNKKVTHSDKSLITLDEIVQGLRVADTNTMLQVKITFANKDKKIVKAVLEEICAVSIEAVKEKYASNEIDVIAAASEPVSIARSAKLYVLLAGMIGIVVGAVFVLFYESQRNLLYETKDISKSAGHVFEIKYSKVKEDNHETSK